MPHSKLARWISVFILFFTLGLFGCQTLKESGRGIAGVSTKILEDKRNEAIKKTFGYDFAVCQDKTKECLKKIGAYIYSRDAKKQLIAIYVSDQDTTPVGVFFTQVDNANTQVEVSSPSKYAKELISRKLFSYLEESLHPDLTKGKPDAK